MTQGKNVQVFISYSRRDFPFLRDVVDHLKRHNINVWVDVAKLGPGRVWGAEIQQALDSCSHIVVILSPTSAQSPNVKSEVEHAIETKKTIIPLLLQQTKGFDEIERLQWLDCRTDFDKAMRNLIDLLTAKPNASSETDIASLTEPNRSSPYVFYNPSPRCVKAIGFLMILSAGLKFGAVFPELHPDDGSMQLALILTCFLQGGVGYLLTLRKLDYAQVILSHSVASCFVAAVVIVFLTTGQLFLPIRNVAIATPILDLTALVLMPMCKSFRRWLPARGFGIWKKE